MKNVFANVGEIPPESIQGATRQLRRRGRHLAAGRARVVVLRASLGAKPSPRRDGVPTARNTVRAVRMAALDSVVNERRPALTLLPTRASSPGLEDRYASVPDDLSASFSMQVTTCPKSERRTRARRSPYRLSQCAQHQRDHAPDWQVEDLH